MTKTAAARLDTAQLTPRSASTTPREVIVVLRRHHAVGRGRQCRVTDPVQPIAVEFHLDGHADGDVLDFEGHLFGVLRICEEVRHVILREKTVIGAGAR